ncbi:class I SAM-dependent methyltransferase [Actinoallomurus rhizosphaericola]|uniref:class I SAM-dependent methyltransferase n=1 Tax=Actinoallomurus rhizosphaericola TaxID=2952536 RepID=UPI0020905B56|nr:class I SAM-dependent methyltransferase [Actinoallomurus rhizosphaericola]MCO5992092.1 class I SAM-dependent methyltransferase [Actinoallomurus rhizosphaericola]
MDWYTWHDGYDQPGSRLAQRLPIVQGRIVEALDNAGPGSLKVISMCAGQGHDILGVLTDHPRRHDVSARLVERDPRNVAVAENTARSAGLDKVEVVAADAGLFDQYKGMMPADIVLVCGVFGNILDEDIQLTISGCRELCKTGGSVIWTRRRSAPDQVPQICAWFEEQGFERQWLSDASWDFGVAMHRFVGEPQPFSSRRMFTFRSK